MPILRSEPNIHSNYFNPNWEIIIFQNTLALCLNEQLKSILKDFKDSLPDEWKKLLDNPETLKAKISQIARELPADVYDVIRDELISKLLSGEEHSSAALSFVVDSNIIVGDSFRVGKGNKSSTERIFSSVFVKLYAPKSIENEVLTQIKNDLPQGCSLEVAISHAKKLLSKIILVDDSKFTVEHSELTKFRDKFGNDAAFLKVGLVLGVNRIITRDKAFDQSQIVKRFELGKAVSLIVGVESGALSISIIGEATYIGAKAIYWLLLSLYKVLAEVYAFLAMIVSGGIAGLVSVLERAPKWVWYILLAIMAGAGIAFAISKDLRDKAITEIVNLYDWISSQSKRLFDIFSNLLKGSIDLAVIFKDELGPYFVNVGLAMALTITEMKETFESQ